MILIILGIIFAVLPIFINNPRFITEDRDISSNNNGEKNFDNVNLQISAVSGNIHIDGNSGWLDFRNDGNCTGNGTYTEPYIIEDLIINGILIEDSDVYFRIENCTIYNSYWRYGGILLTNVSNSQLINNNSTSHYRGISLSLSKNNTISGNTINKNYHGIDLYYSNENIISGNTANYNICGIFLDRSNYSIVSGNNLIGNDFCINETDCEGNVFENNICRKESSISGYNLFFLFAFIIGVIILIRKKIKS